MNNLSPQSGCLKNPERGCVVLDQPQPSPNFQSDQLSSPCCGWSATQPRSFFRQAPARQSSFLSLLAIALITVCAALQVCESAEQKHLDAIQRGAHPPNPLRLNPPVSGEVFPDLAAYPLEGSLPEMKGKVLLVDFWASWCVPCKKSFKTLNDLHQRFGPEGLVILAINVDEKPKDMARFLSKNPAGFAVVRDAGQKLVGALEVKTMPTSFIVDRDGRVHSIHSGYQEDETPGKYEREITTLLRSTAAKK